MAMTMGGGGGYSSDINVTPMIDVLLVLLIIFMVIVPVTPKGLDALVPQPPKNPSSRRIQTTAPSWCRFCTSRARPRRTRSTRPTSTMAQADRGSERIAGPPDRDLCQSRRAHHVRQGRRQCRFPLCGRGDRYWPRRERGSHRIDDAEDHGRPVAALRRQLPSRGALRKLSALRCGRCRMRWPKDARSSGWPLRWPGRFGIPGKLQCCQPRPEAVHPGGKQEYNFSILVSVSSRPRPAAIEIPGA